MCDGLFFGRIDKAQVLTIITSSLCRIRCQLKPVLLQQSDITRSPPGFLDIPD